MNPVLLGQSKAAAGKEYASPVQMANLAIQAGRTAEALGYLERALGERDPKLVYLQRAPEFDAPHSDRACAALVARINLPPLSSGI